MSIAVETLKPLLNGMGFNEGRIDAAPAVLKGDDGQPVVDEPLLWQKEVCSELNISHTTLRRISPPSYQVGGRKRYKLSEVLDHMADPSTSDHTAGTRGAE
ncbi:MAG: hypothetical protein HN919_22225 [Verrucomicrobia bacterium]|jgi:hypothetical protein|nr:hypothetical protein [Verrucomicrobiota bacterium]MBT7069031.1 hypothetical protein [Verrucomicrobiota bacterium]MBT7699724.1 hypothetical protein [Verrucomicrobiota bacterium]